MNEQGLDLEQVAAAEELEGEEKSPRLKRIELIQNALRRKKELEEIQKVDGGEVPAFADLPDDIREDEDINPDSISNEPLTADEEWRWQRLVAMRKQWKILEKAMVIDAEEKSPQDKRVEMAILEMFGKGSGLPTIGYISDGKGPGEGIHPKNYNNEPLTKEEEEAEYELMVAEKKQRAKLQANEELIAKFQPDLKEPRGPDTFKTQLKN